jgi:hypothetical protein
MRTGTCRSTKLFSSRQARLKALEALDERAKQLRGREEIWPFRVPHEPLDLEEIVDGVAAEALRSRTVLRLEWADAAWELWTIALPSGILLYCDCDGHESRILASVRRGNPSEADGFFLERLAESRGAFFGIEMAGPAPDRVRSCIGDREFLTDVFVDLFEGTGALPVESPDFRTDVIRWLDRVLACPAFTKRQPRIEEAERS